MENLMIYLNINKKTKVILLSTILFTSFNAEAGIWSFFSRIKAFIISAIKKTPAPEQFSPINPAFTRLENEVDTFVALFCSKLESHKITCAIYSHFIKDELKACLLSAQNRFPSGDIMAALNILATNTYYRAYYISTIHQTLKLTTEQSIQIAIEEMNHVYKENATFLNKIHSLDEIPEKFLSSLSDKNVRDRVFKRMEAMHNNPSFNPHYNPLYPSL